MVQVIEKFFMKRSYRRQFKTDGLFSFLVEEMESDLFIICDVNLEKEAKTALLEARRQIEEYIREFPAFGESLEPVNTSGNIPPIPLEMIRASNKYGVGPMAAVAGAVAQYIGETLSPLCSHLIIENGGDICLKSQQPVLLSVYTGDNSKFSEKLFFKLDTGGKLTGVCTSSGRIGHSLSFGDADAVVAIAERTEDADAAATSLGNRIKYPEDIERVISEEVGRNILTGLIIVMDDKMGAWGDIEFV
jgi:uncharacterized protein